MCTIKLRFPFPRDNTCNLRLIGLEWSDRDIKPRFGIVRSSEYGRHLDSLQDGVHQWHYDSKGFLEALDRVDISRAMKIHHKLAGDRQVAVVTIRPELQLPEYGVCNSYYYTVTLSVDIKKEVMPLLFKI